MKKRIKKVIIGVLLVSFLLFLGHNGYDLLKANQNKREKERIYQNYDVSKIQLRILNGDGASWISQLATKNTI